MRIFFLLGLMFTTLTTLAQQQVIPEEFNAAQARLFQKVTEAVSTPCCQNGIPVAFHASGQAELVREEVTKAIRAGKKEREIMTMLGEMRFGPEQKDTIIFTVPDRNPLGYVYWGLGVLLLLVLIPGAWFLLKQGRSQAMVHEDGKLVEKWRDHIRAQVESA